MTSFKTRQRRRGQACPDLRGGVVVVTAPQCGQTAPPCRNAEAEAARPMPYALPNRPAEGGASPGPPALPAPIVALPPTAIVVRV